MMNNTEAAIVKPSLVIFDFDNTILEGDCELKWCEFLTTKGIIDHSFVEKILEYVAEYETGKINYSDYEKFLIHPLIHFPAVELQALINDFIEQLQPFFRPYMLQQVDTFRDQRYTLLLVTASTSLLAVPIAHRLGISHLICTRIELQNGSPTGKLLGEPAFQQEKVEKVKTWMTDNPVTKKGSWCFSDSINDLPILTMVDHPVAVTPDNSLRRHARENHWQIIERIS
jgi:HAD superfamily hydrolase (TIGR01490 family)